MSAVETFFKIVAAVLAILALLGLAVIVGLLYGAVTRTWQEHQAQRAAKQPPNPADLRELTQHELDIINSQQGRYPPSSTQPPKDNPHA